MTVEHLLADGRAGKLHAVRRGQSCWTAGGEGQLRTFHYSAKDRAQHLARAYRLRERAMKRT